MKVAKVIVDVPATNVNNTFDYQIPEKFETVIEIGMRVLVPFGRRKVMGFVVDLTNESKFENLRPIIRPLDIIPTLTKELIKLGNKMAHETLCFYITAYLAMLPQALRSTYKKVYEVVQLTTIDERLKALLQNRSKISEEELVKNNIPLSLLKKEIEKGNLTVRYLVKHRGSIKKTTMVKPALSERELELSLNDLRKNALKQKEVIQYFIQNYKSIALPSLIQKLNVQRSTIQTLVKREILKTYTEEVLRNPYEHYHFKKTEPFKLTKQQEKAFVAIEECINQNKFNTFLLHGVTGSGKTEIYLQAIQKVVEKGKEAIFLVPEISLTPQMVKQFKQRFGKNVAVMHSGLSIGEKYDEWRKVQQKKVQVVVGARSAIFAPFDNLGIIIIDEEHETTYKQEDQPRYHARDVAKWRAETYNCPLVLGSATPTLESFARAQKNKYKLLCLTERTNEMDLPTVEVIDMREELHKGNRSMFSRSLIEGIQNRLEKKEQVILLLNRRGFATFIMCRDCGYVEECPNCDIALTYHQQDRSLKCHYCMYQVHVPMTCPSCKSKAIRHFGTGTQKVEVELKKLFSKANILRMDVDTTRRKGSHERILQKFYNQEADILIGTQMIAKGLDFKQVTLVGVLTADSMLHLPDFRASEKTFQLLTQVSGRAGRHDLPGEVFIQTYTPDHYSIQLASEHDYESFYKKEMFYRKQFHYPPFVYLVMIQISHENEVKTVQTAQTIYSILKKYIGNRTILLGPTPSPISRLKGKYRYQIIIKHKNEPKLLKVLQYIQNFLFDEIKKNQLQIKIDTQPFHFM